MLQRTDAELVRAARGGDVSSFGELYCRHYKRALAIAYCWLSDRHLAEDASQEAFAIACRDLDRLRRADRFAQWLAAICRKVARRTARSRRRRVVRDDATSPLNSDDGDERLEAVRQSVQRLPPKAREVILLHYYSGLTYDEVARTLGTSPQAVHGRLIRARRKMAEDLKRNGFGGKQS